MNKNKNKIITLSALALGVALTVAGLLLGGYGEVLGKAVRVCLECVGIG